MRCPLSCHPTVASFCVCNTSDHLASCLSLCLQFCDTVGAAGALVNGYRRDDLRDVTNAAKEANQHWQKASMAVAAAGRLAAVASQLSEQVADDVELKLANAAESEWGRVCEDIALDAVTAGTQSTATAGKQSRGSVGELPAVDEHDQIAGALCTLSTRTVLGLLFVLFQFT